jgi:hypothetical protein
MRLYLIGAIALLAGLALFAWALFAWKSVGFVMGPNNSPDGRLGGFFIFVLTLGLGSMIGGASLFIRRRKPGKDSPSLADGESERASELDATQSDKPFARPWLYVNFIGFFGGIVAFLLLWKFDLDLQQRGLMENWIGAAVGISIVSFSLRAIYIGSVPNEDDPYLRSRNPFKYWAVVAFSLLIGIVVTLMGILGIAN